MMADSITENILDDWGLSCLKRTFKDQGVDFEALIGLTPGSPFVGQLLKNELLGTQIKFEKKLKKYLLNQSVLGLELEVTVGEMNNSDSSINLPVLPSPQIEIESPVNEVYVDETAAKSPPANISDFDGENHSEVLTDSESLSEKQFFDSLVSLDIYSLLYDTFKGRIILLLYDRKRELNEKQQSEIVDIVVSHLLCYSDPFGQPFALKNHHYEFLGKLLCKIFPTEDLSIYYVAPKTEDSLQKISKGKIPDAFRNKLRILRDAEIIPRKRKINDKHSDTEEDSDKYGNCKVAIVFLRFNTSPWNTIEEFWDKSFPFREKLRRQDGGIVNVFLQEFPILKHPDGYMLLERDYKSMFKHGEREFYVGWPEFARKLYQIMQTDIKDVESKIILESLRHSSVQPDVRDLTLLTLMSALCPPTCRIIGKNKTVWKPSILESSNGFILHVKNAAELENQRNARRANMYGWKLPLQPYVIIVGPNFSEISACYINVDEIIFKVESPFKAVDVCYKIFHVLNAKYPPESEQVWLLLQQNLYNHVTTEDKQIKGVLRLRHKFANLKL